MASPKNWDSNHPETRQYPFRWDHRNAPASIWVEKSTRGHDAGLYSVKAKYRGVNHGRIAKQSITNKDDARSKAVKLARMYTNSEDLKSDITKVEFGRTL